MMLSDVRDYVASLGIAEPEHVYQGTLDSKKEKSIGVYNSKHAHTHKTAIGGPSQESYGTKYVTLLVHWNKSPKETETAAERILKALTAIDDVVINNQIIKFAQPLYEIQDVGKDDAGICEMVIEAAVIYSKKGTGNE